MPNVEILDTRPLAARNAIDCKELFRENKLQSSDARYKPNWARIVRKSYRFFELGPAAKVTFYRRFRPSPGDIIEEIPEEVPKNPPFLSHAAMLEARGRSDEALDLIYDVIDERLRRSEFGRLDSELSRIEVKGLSIDLMLGLLTASLPAKHILNSRAELFCKVEHELKSQGEYEDGLLAGLEPDG